MSHLTDRLNEELRLYGLVEYPIARQIASIVKDAMRPWWRFYFISIFVAFAAGAMLDYTWHGIQITAIQENLAAWRQEYEAEHKKHHSAELKPMGKALAQVTAQGKEQEP
jgi:hypothetical protein